MGCTQSRQESGKHVRGAGGVVGVNSSSTTNTPPSSPPVPIATPSGGTPNNNNDAKNRVDTNSQHQDETKEQLLATPQGSIEEGEEDDAAGNWSPTPANPAAAIDPGMFIRPVRAHLSDRYLRERKLGSGAYGEVLLCRDRQTGAERAVKIIKKASVTQQAGSNLLEEVSVLRQLDHPNIMKLYEFFEDKKNYYLVSEVYRGGELFDEIINRQKFTEADAANTMKQVLSGVTYLHKHSIVHRDLKPENLLLESKAPDALIKIVDFGLSSSFDPKKKLKDRLGTAYYIAPEVLKQKYDEKCDIWSCGVILYILLCGYPPFGGNTDKEILYRVGKGKFSFEAPEWDATSPEVKDLITKMLTFDPQRRLTAEACLKHPWIRKVADRGSKVELPSLLNALGNMKKFQASQKLAQAALLFIGSKLTTMEETKELTKIFRKLDANGDGQLDRRELIHGYEQMMKIKGEDVSSMTKAQVEEQVDRILASVDFDRNGFIEYSEFVTVAMDRRALLSRERLQAAFSMFDEDGSGKIAAAELRNILHDVDDAQWKQIITEVDQNGDGEVDFEEFVEMMQKLY